MTQVNTAMRIEDLSLVYGPEPLHIVAMVNSRQVNSEPIKGDKFHAIVCFLAKIVNTNIIFVSAVEPKEGDDGMCRVQISLGDKEYSGKGRDPGRAVLDAWKKIA